MSSSKEAHSVLFDADDQYYRPDDPAPTYQSPPQSQSTDHLQYYQTDYSHQQYDDFTPSQQTYNNSYENNFSGPIQVDFWKAFGTGGLPGEPGLLEELEINFSHIKTKTITVLNPLKTVDSHMMDDVDLAGPVLFCLLLGGALLFGGKITFSYIYGVAVVGCASMYLILNMMSEQGIDFFRNASVLGYCLLPIVFLSMLNTFLSLISVDKSITMYVLAPVAIFWATYSSSLIFVTVLQMHEQRLLVAYPIALLYTCFSLLTLF